MRTVVFCQGNTQNQKIILVSSINKEIIYRYMT